MKHKIIGIILLLSVAVLAFAACGSKGDNDAVNVEIDQEILSSLPVTVELTGADEIEGALSVSVLSDTDKAAALSVVKADYYVAEDATVYALDVKIVKDDQEVTIGKPVTLSLTIKSPLLPLEQYVVFHLHNGTADEITPRVEGGKLTVTVTGFSTFLVLPKHTHTLQTSTTATCTQAGVTTVTCSVCGTTLERRATDALGHDLQEVAAKEPTEKEIGWSAHKVCTRCGEKVGYTERPATGTPPHEHIYSDWVVVRPATCTSKGLERATCSCGKEQTRDIAPLGHDPILHPAVASTCTEAGNIDYYVCDRCGRYYMDESATKETTLSAVRTAPAHQLVFCAAVANSCTEDGSIAHYACSVCHSLFEDESAKKALTADQIVIPAKHNMNVHAATDATCTEEGNLLYYRCTKCQKYYTDLDGKDETTEEAVTLTALGHIDENADEHCDRCGKFVGEYEQLFFGSYPQTLASEETSAALTALIPQEDYPQAGEDKAWTFCGTRIGSNASVRNLWYLDQTYEDEKYRGIYSADQEEGGDLYWFRYEPIRWRVLTQADGTALLLSDMVIDCHAYLTEPQEGEYEHNDGVGYASDYALSDIRQWLNDTFFDTAFSALEKEAILLTTVDNSAKSTNPKGEDAAWNDGANDYACEDTQDYLFLLSTEEITNGDYYFNSADDFDEFRTLIPTDYAEAMGVYVFAGNGSAPWWLRSAHYSGEKNVQIVTFISFVSTTADLDDATCGVVPALWIDRTLLG